MAYPDGYADTFRVLAENKVVSRALLPKSERMAGFRNVVVYHYDKVDAAIVVDILRKRLADFEALKKAVLRLAEVKSAA